MLINYSFIYLFFIFDASRKKCWRYTNSVDKLKTANSERRHEINEKNDKTVTTAHDRSKSELNNNHNYETSRLQKVYNDRRTTVQFRAPYIIRFSSCFKMWHKNEHQLYLV